MRASPATADWFATSTRVPRKVALHGVSNGTDEPLSPVSGTFGNLVTSVPDGVSSTSWLARPARATYT